VDVRVPIKSDHVSIGRKGWVSFPSRETGEGNDLHRRQRWFKIGSRKVDPCYDADANHKHQRGGPNRLLYCELPTFTTAHCFGDAATGAFLRPLKVSPGF